MADQEVIKSIKHKLRTLRAGIARAKFEEGKHKRDATGKFADKPGTGKKGGSLKGKAPDFKPGASSKVKGASSPERLKFQRLAEARAKAKPGSPERRKIDREIADNATAQFGVKVQSAGGKRDAGEAPGDLDKPKKSKTKKPVKEEVNLTQDGATESDSKRPDADGPTDTADSTPKDATGADSGASKKVPSIADALKDDNFEVTTFEGTSNEVHVITNKKTGEKTHIKKVSNVSQDDAAFVENEDGSFVQDDFGGESVVEAALPSLASSLGFQLNIPTVSVSDDGEIQSQWIDDAVPEGWKKLDAPEALTGDSVSLDDLVKHGESFDGEGRKSLLELHIMDFVTNQTDRHAGNWIEFEDEDGARKVVPIDNGAAFGVLNGEFTKDPIDASYEDWASLQKPQQIRLMMVGAYGDDMDAFKADLDELIGRLDFDADGPDIAHPDNEWMDEVQDDINGYLDNRFDALPDMVDDIVSAMTKYAKESK